MQRTFIILPEFDKNWKSMGLSDEDLRRLENLSKAERNTIHKLIEALEHTLRS